MKERAAGRGRCELPAAWRNALRGGAALLLCLSGAHAAPARVAAFPGAVGQGASARGGRGGDVYHVTSLDDYVPDREPKNPRQSRHALRSAQGPRTIVFDVSGVVQLHAPLAILKSELTVAGQTSPGGITLCGFPLEISRGHDVVIRYLRVRTGDFHVRDAAEGDTGALTLDPGSANAINVGNGCDHVILDHVSASWSIDETLSVTGCRNVTVQHCIISESLDRSFHPKGPHGYGSLVRGQLTPEDQAAGRGGFTFFGNLWAHHRARNPSIGGQQRIPHDRSPDQRLRTDVNLVNNVIYNWGDSPTHRSQLGDVRINLIGNYYINGPAKASSYVFREGDAGRTELFHRGNFHDADQDGIHNGHSVTQAAADRAFHRFDSSDRLLTDIDQPPFDFLQSCGGNVLSAQAAYDMVVRSAGASLWRDAIDVRVIRSVVDRRGSLIDSQEAWRDSHGVLAGIDHVPVVQRPRGFDTDRDGLPDIFETEHGLNPQDPDDRNGRNLDGTGYTNLEVYLNSLLDT